MRKLSEHLFAETGYTWANVGAAVTDAGVILIDCPVRPAQSKDWQEKLRTLSPKGIRYVIGTDFHGDHTTGTSFLDREITIISQQRVCEEIRKGDNAFAKKIFVDALDDQGNTEEAKEIREASVPLPDICFGDWLSLNFPPLTLEISHRGGHSPACSVIYVPEENVIFAGDVVINNPPSYMAGMRDANVTQWIEALSWIDNLPDDLIVVPGHGEICGKKDVRNLRERFLAMWKIMETLIKKGRSKSDAVADSAFLKYFYADESLGAQWVQQRKKTFQEGLERLYDEVIGG